MPRFEIPCQCGASLVVLASEAGTNRTCVCGRIVSIPRLSELRQRFRPIDDDRKKRAVKPVVAIGIVSVVSLILVLLMWSQPQSVFPITLMMFVVGKVWFLGVMFGEMGTRALLVFVVPFFDWLFLIIRFDVAWKPVLLQIVSVVLGVIAMAARSS